MMPREPFPASLAARISQSGCSLFRKRIALPSFNVVAFSKFDGDNDPHGERDFGTIYKLASGDWTQTRPDDSKDIAETVFWKIDYYDNRLEYGSDAPWDASKTTRVLTIMLASEY